VWTSLKSAPLVDLASQIAQLDAHIHRLGARLPIS